MTKTEELKKEICDLEFALREKKKELNTHISHVTLFECSGCGKKTSISKLTYNMVYRYSSYSSMDCDPHWYMNHLSITCPKCNKYHWISNTSNKIYDKWNSLKHLFKEIVEVKENEKF
jgi:hypothetical protein